jgi:hypothetical protein
VIGNEERTIVGVVENFKWHSLKEPHVPYVIGLTDVRQNPYLSVRMSTSDITRSLAQVESSFVHLTLINLLNIFLQTMRSIDSINQRFNLEKYSFLSRHWQSLLHVPDSLRWFPSRQL